MHTGSNLPSGSWRAVLSRDQEQLLEQAWYLLERERQNVAENRVTDYGFLVFTAAKVYEGFLKTFLYQLGLISRGAYFNNHFRIGKALNPDLPTRFRDEDWLFADLVGVCGEELAMRLWGTWKLARNSVFHYEPGPQHYLSYQEARDRVTAVLETVKAAADCERKIKRLD